MACRGIGETRVDEGQSFRPDTEAADDPKAAASNNQEEVTETLLGAQGRLGAQWTQQGGCVYGVQMVKPDRTVRSMEAREAFIRFVSAVLVKEKAERFGTLATTTKGQRKIMIALCHEIEPAVRPSAVRRAAYDPVLEEPCFVFFESIGFGVPLPTVREAYEKISVYDWLIVLRDASAGIYRPESRWDDETLLVADQRKTW